MVRGGQICGLFENVDPQRPAGAYRSSINSRLVLTDHPKQSPWRRCNIVIQVEI